MRKLAAHHIQLSDGTMIHKHVVTIDEQGRLVEYHPLRGEEPFVEWYPGKLVVNSNQTIKI